MHAEAGPHLHRSLQAIRAEGKRAGVAINPATPVSAIAHVIADIDLVLVMSVNPGFGGQKFIPESLEKIRQVRALIGHRNIDLEVDGGISVDNARALAEAGADLLRRRHVSLFRQRPQDLRHPHRGHPQCRTDPDRVTDPLREKTSPSP